MDVTPARPPQQTDTAAREGAPMPRATAMAPAPRPTAGAPDGGRWTPHSSLKYTLTSADVDARFEIHEGTSRVTVTMYDRETGEVLREIPPRRVLDVVAALTGRGLTVDAES
jgi:hypothetical protein